ncbi:uncharacterized protein LOC124460653 [Drosophila willistoni]|uniref:uncharacterized protein LOC124460653 n=1 Tax=Drosophila willistoni TaxID=7260 RepID=UPI001F076DDC|nr:uncharacterized protein LOC124460653 [Drosophila willistoni]
MGNYYLRGLLKVLGGLTKPLAVNEFQYNSERELFVSSKFWHEYLKLAHYLFIFPLIWPAIKMYLMDQLHTNFDYDHIRKLTAYSIIFSRHSGIFGSGFALVYRSKDLCHLLNLFSNLWVMHYQLFGRSVQVSSFSLFLHFIREFVPFYFMVHSGRNVPYLQYIMAIVFGRGMFIYYLCDVAMLLHMSLLKSLHKYFERPPRRRKARRRCCLKYYQKLLQLREGIQCVSWISHTSRLISEIVFICWFGLDYMFNDQGQPEVFVTSLCFCFANSNILHVVNMARGIHIMEQEIIQHFHRQDMMKSLRLWPKCPQSKWSFLMLEQLHLKRCLLKHRSVSLTNYFYVRQSLLLEIFGFVFTNATLLASLSLKYK